MNRARRFTNSSQRRLVERRLAYGGTLLPRGYIDGLILSNDGTDATNDIAVSAGVCRSTVNIVDGAASTLNRDQIDLEIPVSIIKQLDVSFVPSNYDGAGIDGGTRSGMLSSSSISNTTWHIYVVGRRGEQSEIIAHDSAAQANVLAEMGKIGGYTAYRRIGSIVRTGGALKAFTQRGDKWEWTTPTLDYSNATPGTSAVTATLTVPIGIAVLAQLNVACTGSNMYVSALTSDDLAASGSSAPLSTEADGSNTTVTGNGGIQVWTSTTGTIRARAIFDAPMYIATLSYTDTRGRDA